jgi:integrase
MSPRARGHGVRKVCSCGWKRWPKCSHAWYFSYKPRGGPRHRFSLNSEFPDQQIDSKSDAEKLATDVRSKINAGTFERVVDRRAREQREAAELEAADRVAREQGVATAVVTVVTLDHFAPIFIDRVAKASGKASWKDDDYLLTTVRNHRTADGRRLGEWALGTITEDELEAFHAAQRARGRAVSTLNHFVQVLKRSFRWAAKKGYLARSPISDDSQLKRGKHAKRARRLNPDEETALLSAASALSRGCADVRLSGLIVAALETGCRQGELLALQWADVNLAKATLLVRAIELGAKKTGSARTIPISARLGAILEMAATDPAGRQFPPGAYVFGLLGEPVDSVDKAWESCVLRAHGHEPVWTTNGKLAPQSRAALRDIDLHFHDLRHEAGSRWLEAGMPLHHIKELLGHANISQTDTYLNAGRLALQDSIKRFDAERGKSVAKDPTTEHRPRGHENVESSSKDLLH